MLSRHVRALAVAALLAAAALVSGCTGGGQAPPVVAGPPTVPATTAARPNIVFILTDDLSTNLVRYMPHVRALEKAGTSFSNFTVTDSLCCPSRASILTGKFPHNTGVFTNAGDDGGITAFQRRHNEASTFAVALQKAGYRTAMMGKYLNGYEPEDHSAPGWAEWDVAGAGYRGFDYDLNQNQHVVHYGSSPQDYLTDVLGRRAAQFIAARPKGDGQSAPFMLEVATFAPHRPFVPAPRDAHRFKHVRAPRAASYDRLPQEAPRWLAPRRPLTPEQDRVMDHVFRKRVRSVQAVDRMVGTIETALRRSGHADDTYLFFASDNGFHLGEYRLPPGKMTAFDTDVRVPLVATGPGIPAGRVSDALAENIDLAPTFESLAGLEPSDDVDGRSLVPVLHGATPSEWRTAALIEHHKPDAFTIGPDLDGDKEADPPSYEAMRTRDYLYVEYVDGEREFYDLRNDPDELDNLAARLPSTTLEALHRNLSALEECHGARECTSADHPAPVPGADSTAG